MSEIVIQAENISKFYRLGKIGSGSLRRDMQAWWQHKIMRKQEIDFYESNKASGKDFLWALREIDLEIKQGEAWGIIGHNGAGKSTFLKILSRIIKPTSGRIRGKGRLSSLLEVGTGFHPDLSGRENIYISGHMIGMNKQEISQKFDDIVEFSGVAEFLETPVKRYSSGMYVRLAFAVDAHLEPDILLVDEVLAVGDAEFQKKCLGKMNEASTKNGRTVIFVSHNLQAVSNLCTKAMWLEKGTTRDSGDAKRVINHYLSTLQKKVWKLEYKNRSEAPGNDHISIKQIELQPHFIDDNNVIDIRTPLTIKFRFFYFGEQKEISTSVVLFTISGECIFDITSSSKVFSDSNMIEGECTIPGNFLNDGSYYITIYFIQETSKELFSLHEALAFEIADYRENTNWYDKWWGYVRPNFPLTLTEVGHMD